MAEQATFDIVVVWTNGTHSTTHRFGDLEDAKDSARAIIRDEPVREPAVVTIGGRGAVGIWTYFGRAVLMSGEL